MLRKGTYLVLAAYLLLYQSPVHGEVCLGPLPNYQHQISGQLCIIDQSTMELRDFSYDGRGPDTFLYWYPTGDNPTYTADNVRTTYRGGGGNIIRHPNPGASDGRFPRQRVTDIDLRFSLSEGVYACDMAVFTIWCRDFSTQFTSIDIPASTFTDSASEAAGGDKILCTRTGGGGAPVDGVCPGFENCKQLDESLTLSWTVNRTAETVLFMLCGCSSTDIEQPNTWLGFGLSGNPSRTQMFGADASIVWVDDNDGPQAVDYYLSAYTQCRAGQGACPDTVDSTVGSCSNDVTLITGLKKDGQQCVVYSRKFAAEDECDLTLDPDKDQYIVWGVGGLGETAFRHFKRATSSDDPIRLGRDSASDCISLTCLACDAYQNQRLAAPTNTTFVAHIGPSGDQRGYMGITNQAGWGIAWYINDTLIPELVVQRGQTYTFIVYGGDNPSDTARYHPFYITSSISGGITLNDDQNNDEVVYAGFEGDTPLGVGPLCESESNVEAEDILKRCDSLLCHYEEALTPPNCTTDSSTDNSFTWTPDDDTSDLVYYQCATHINLGWRIRVVDNVEEYVTTTDWPDTSTCPELPPATNATSETTGDSDTSTCPDLPANITETTGSSPTSSPTASPTPSLTENSAPPLSVSYLLLLLVIMNIMF